MCMVVTGHGYDFRKAAYRMFQLCDQYFKIATLVPAVSSAGFNCFC